MGSVTGIELGPDYCVLVKARMRAESIEVGEVRIFEPGQWPENLAARASLLARARRELGLPRRTWVVSWNFSQVNSFPAATPPAPQPRNLLRQAGFQIEAVLSPLQALALLAGSRSPLPGGAEAAIWLAVNRQGAAMAIVRGFETLYAREFAWRIAAPEQRVQAHLLRRYLMVAQLTPEIRRGVEAVRAQHGIVVDLAMACGTLEDLRSLTMPLIAGLDIEFETLDSPAEIDVTGGSAGVAAQKASTVHLAWVTAAAAASQGRHIALGRWLGAAAVAVLAIGAGWWAFGIRTDYTGRATTIVPQSPPAPSGQSERPQSAAPRPPRERQLEASLPETPVKEGLNRAAQSPRPASDLHAASSGAGSQAAPQPTTGVDRPDPVGGSASQALDAPLPSVGGILISGDRRFAVIDGSVVSPGDRVGPRVVARIESNAVILREPSGREIRVRVRGRGRI
jgi:hypothetical protein